MMPNSYAVILICREIDGFEHNSVFANEIASALIEFDISSKIYDYRTHPRLVKDALQDERCVFFICFNGFGSELSLANDEIGQLNSVFQKFNKPLFDVMHDCPTNETLSHQMLLNYPQRYVLSTDYGYVHEAHELNIHNVRFVPSITFPKTQPDVVSDVGRRSIRWLLPIQLPPPSLVKARLAVYRSYRARILKNIFEAVSDACIADLCLDPRVETRRACREVGLLFDAFNADHRFLLTAIADLVKFERRRNLLQGLAGLPITILTTASMEDTSHGGFEYLPARNFGELLAAMANSDGVICPLPHHTGFHERALGAFSVGAAVLAAPNAVLESEFVDGRDFLSYSRVEELAEMLGRLSDEPQVLSEIAERGHSRAHQRFSPKRLVEAILSLARVFR
ncbi:MULTISPECIES: glycosyltransferase [unclassified Aureimonas]|uniref:glycosyltransferase n=1 Tax=unclassified Aureimonas TaxID=2615206 RepID=UPI00138F0B99|nr:MULTISPECIES: glycosyltransferase [unclassified Aureimonas]